MEERSGSVTLEGIAAALERLAETVGHIEYVVERLDRAVYDWQLAAGHPRKMSVIREGAPLTEGSVALRVLTQGRGMKWLERQAQPPAGNVRRPLGALDPAPDQAAG